MNNNRLPPFRRNGIVGNAQLPGVAELLRVQQQHEQQQLELGLFNVVVKS
jgi:hypothetical protein